MEYNSKDLYLNYFYNIYDMIKARDGNNSAENSPRTQNWILSVYS